MLFPRGQKKRPQDEELEDSKSEHNGLSLTGELMWRGG